MKIALAAGVWTHVSTLAAAPLEATCALLYSVRHSCSDLSLGSLCATGIHGQEIVQKIKAQVRFVFTVSGSSTPVVRPLIWHTAKRRQPMR
eukprot:scaffold1306_cov399-Prasinococcus_capsulatus_cf.AAC.8